MKTQPLLNLIPNFDALKDQPFYFTYLGSERVIDSQLEIREDKIGSAPVYSAISSRFDKIHTLPENSLQNGKKYLAKIRVKINESNWSIWSPEVSFNTLRTPKVIFENLQEEKFVYNNDVIFRALFSQEQGDRPKTYNFILMDQNKVKIESFPTRTPEPHAPNYMQERVKNLVKGRLYYIGVYVQTQNGLDFFDYHEFIPHFIAPNTSSVVNVRPENHDGQVLVQSFLTQTTGIQTAPMVTDNEVGISMMPNYTFLDDDWVVVPEHRPLKFIGLGVGKASDFVVELWCKNIKDGEFMTFETEHNNDIDLHIIKQNDSIIVQKEYLNESGTGQISRHRSNIIPDLGMKSFYLYIKVIEFRVDVYIELV